MAEKKAFVFDTNFIIQIQKLDSVIENLKEVYTVYVSQVSIDERIAQECRNKKAEYDDLELIKEKYKSIAKVEILHTYERFSAYLIKGMQTNYEQSFGNNIIPFFKDEQTFSTVIDRANKKLPPFSAEKGASDKGFKDCILWLSLLSFFKDHGEDEVVFTTDDQIFLKNAEFLVDEFQQITGKKIEIKPNSYYKEIITPQKEEKTPLPKTTESLPLDLDSLRDQINSIMNSFCTVITENYYGDENWLRTFITSIKFDADCIAIIFENMGSVLHAHLLDKAIPASKLLNANPGIKDDDAEIPINEVEKAVKLYESIKANYPELLNQLFEASAKILNNNFVVSQSVSEDELPF